MINFIQHNILLYYIPTDKHIKHIIINVNGWNGVD